MTKALQALIVASVIALGPAAASALEPPEGYPRKPIELVVVYPAGGGMDVTARTLAKQAEDILGHEFRVSNRVGGGGMVGHTYLAKEAKPDGYTVGVLSMGALFNHVLVHDVSFTPDDFEPIGFINFEPYLYATRGESYEEIIAKAKELGPGEVRIGIVPGSTSDLILATVEEHEGVKFAQVPFQGGTPRLVGLLNGTIDIAPVFYTEAEQYFETGELRPVAVADTEPLPDLPDTPTLAEFGVPVTPTVFGAARVLVLPKGVPEDIATYLEEAFLQVLNAEQTKEAYAKIGLEVAPMTAEETKEVYQEVFDVTKQLTEKLASN